MTLEDAGLEQQPVPARPAIDGSDVRKLSHADVDRVSLALARAFEDDPIWEFLYPEEKDRVGRYRRAFDFFLRRLWLAEDECYGLAGLQGGALWMPPGRWRVGALDQLRMLPRMLALGGRNFPRIAGVLRLMEKKHPHDRDHYYLAVLGVEPELQGKGFGAALMQPVLNRCDAEGIPAYLESSKERNIAFYERHGFRVTEELPLSKAGPSIWLMWRDPA
jgi:ribosomal protein S18 acetylase RimI-like enzyme